MAPFTDSPAAVAEAPGTDASDGMLPPEPMDAQLTSIQPGDAYIVHLELAWGHLRRWWLKRFRGEYVARMRACRRGEENRCPHEVLDPRDVKFFRNQGGYWWDAEDDPFTWRDRIPFAREGLAELLICSVVCFGGAIFNHWLATSVFERRWLIILGWLDAVALLVIGLLIIWFFRNPRRRIPNEPGTIVSPADGKIVTIERVEHDEFVGGPAVLVGIFLSILNVHTNRIPMASRVIGLTYTRGKYLNALNPESVRENEQLEIRLQSSEIPEYRYRMRQISGAIARRIVCRLKPGEDVSTGELFGMIKLGSRAEVILPDVPELELDVGMGDQVKAGSSVLGRFLRSTADHDRSPMGRG